jgi:formylglycine-generating enzyme
MTAKQRLAILSLYGALVAQLAQAAITIDTVPIDNPGNANDPATENQYGCVNYSYHIGKYDVTVGQYTAFLNAVAATDTYSLYNTSMATDLNIAGISRKGASGSYNYSVIGSPNHPITYVSWGDAVRFANWLNNGQPSGAQGSGTTESGAYTLDGAVSDQALAAVVRNAGAKWFIPSENEWYKAAYYDPVAGHYWTYTTGTDATPASAPPGSIPNTANYYDVSAGFAVTGSTGYSSAQNYLTDVGAYTASASPYGTFDQSGNIWQWNEALVDNSFRKSRGLPWDSYATFLPPFVWNDNFPTDEIDDIGFRVATIPEPSALVLVFSGIALIWGWRSRFNA